MAIATLPARSPIPAADGEYWRARGLAQLAAGNFADAADALEQAAAAMPLNADIYRLLAQALHADGRQADALATGMAVAALESGSAMGLFNIGTAYFMNGHWEPAARWYRLALMFDPELVPANQNLGLILHRQGDVAAANRHYDRAYRRQSLFIEPSATAVRTVLILCASRPGNVPFDDLLPQARNTRINWVVEYAPEGEAAWLPRCDLVFNAIGDADVARRSRAAVDRFLATSHRPLLNPPAQVARTARDLLSGLLAGIPGILVPAVLRLQLDDAQKDSQKDMQEKLAAAGFTYPIIVRPVGEHGGDGVVLLSAETSAETSAEALTLAADSTADTGERYLSSYCEYRSDDGFYRKYRVIFVDRVPYPYHLAIGSQWLTHYVTADMLTLSWKTAEEQRFLEQPAAVLGAAAWSALETIAQRLDLDFCGIDFSMLPDGRVLVFEANATMLVHPETYYDSLKFKNRYVSHILDAFDALLDRRIQAGAAN